MKVTIFLTAVLLAAAPQARSQATPDQVDAATRGGIGFLVSKQDSRGAIREKDTNETALTALSGLAIAAMGNLPGDPTPEGEAVQKALQFLLQPNRQDQDGYFGGRDGSRMYGHGITTLFLSEMIGMGKDNEQDIRIRQSCQRGVDLILRAQRVEKRNGNEGGWRYNPMATDSDLSITIWQLMALRAAKDAGLAVPKEAIDSAVAYIKRAFKESPQVNVPVGFSYTGTQQSTWSTAAEGLLALQVCGEYTAKEVIATADWLLQSPPNPKTTWFYYGIYYYAQGMYQRGGTHAEAAAKSVADALVPLQDADGSWKTSGTGDQVDRIYRTSMALLSLSVKYHYLPIYQR